MRFDHVGITVADLDAATAWYRAAFGLEEEFSFELAQHELRGVVLRGAAGYRIELLERSGSQPGLTAPDPITAALTRGYGHMAFEVDEVDTVFAELLKAGASERMSPRPSPQPGSRMAFVADPEGNLIELLTRPDAT
jgi:catechol 2,3-dioxygenase-like lactoylglutathione lyase family enzyme